MTITNLEERLASMQSHFDGATVNTGGSLYELPPDGDYQALVHRFDFFESNAGQAFLKTELEIQNDPQYSGRIASTVHNLEDPDRIGWLKGHLQLLGMDVDGLDLREIRPGSPRLQELLDTPVAIAIKTSDRLDKDGQPYRNVYVNQRLGAPLTTGGAKTSDVPGDEAGFTHEPAVATADDKIPF